MTKRKPANLVSEAMSETTELAVSKAKGDAAKWRSRYKTAVAEATALEGRLASLLAIKGAKPTRLRRKASRSKRRGVAVIAPATDWHVEERVFPAGVGGKNHFDIAEAEARIKRYYQKVPELVDHQSSFAPVVELWHPLLGDLISGYIHDELMETNELSPTEACVFLQEHIFAGVDLWLKETKLPISIPTCVGNHGRTTAKKQIKTSHMNSFEWLLYKTMAMYYKDNPRVQWMVGEGCYNVQTVMGRKIRFHHGDATRYHGGVGGITIPTNKTVAAWDRIEAVDLDVFGHFHTFLVHYPKWIACGALIGYSEFALECVKAEFQHPSQTFIVVDEFYGVTDAKPIFLTEPQRSKT